MCSNCIYSNDLKCLQLCTIISSFVKNVGDYCLNFIFLLNYPKNLIFLSFNFMTSRKYFYRQNCLSSLQKDSSVINLYNIQQTVVSNEEVEPTVTERIITPRSPHNITSFSWHNFDENRLLTIALSGMIYYQCIQEYFTSSPF